MSEKLSLYGSPECRQRIDCLAGLEKLYGLKFKEFKPVDISLRYTVLEKGQADLSILFTTDPQLAAESEKFVILEDDKHVFPAGNIIFVTSKKVAEEAGPDYEKTILNVQHGLTLEVMQELDARVELEKIDPEGSRCRIPRSGRLPERIGRHRRPRRMPRAGGPSRPSARTAARRRPAPPRRR